MSTHTTLIESAPDERTATVGATSLRSVWLTISMVACTVLMVLVLAAGPLVLGWWAIRGGERTGYLFTDLVFAVVVVASASGWLRMWRPEVAVKRLVAVPVVVQQSGRRLVERSAFGVGSMSEWTSVEPEFGLSLVQPLPNVDEIEQEDQWVARQKSDPSTNSSRARASQHRHQPVAATARGLVGQSVTHTTTRGETFWSLAEQQLGDGKRWTELRERNVGREVAPGVVLSESDGLQAGYQILIPDEQGAKTHEES